MKFKFFLFFVSIAFVFSCKKENPDQTQVAPTHATCSGGITYNPIGGDLAKLKFLTNTYWVYVDSITMQADSVYVNYAQNNPDYYSLTGSCEADACFRNLYRHSLNSRVDSIFLFGRFFMTWKRSGAPFPTAQSPVYYPYNQSWTQQVYGQDTILKQDSVFIYDRFYQQVEKTTIQTDPRENGLKTIYYINSDFGILRKEIFNANGSLKNKWILKSKNILR